MLYKYNISYLCSNPWIPKMTAFTFDTQITFRTYHGRQVIKTVHTIPASIIGQYCYPVLTAGGLCQSYLYQRQERLEDRQERPLRHRIQWEGCGGDVLLQIKHLLCSCQKLKGKMLLMHALSKKLTLAMTWMSCNVLDITLHFLYSNCLL